MAIISRIKALIQGNLNELVNAMSDPGKEIELLVHEMEEAERKGQAELVAAVSAAKLTARRLDETQQEVRRWEERAKQAVRAGDDELARKALAEKALKEKLLSETRAVLVEEHRMADEMRGALREFAARLVEVKARKEALKTQARLARSGSPGPLTSPSMEAFDRLEHRIDRIEAELSLDESPAIRDASTEARFQALSGGPDPRVEDALAELKKKLDRSGEP